MRETVSQRAGVMPGERPLPVPQLGLQRQGRTDTRPRRGKILPARKAGSRVDAGGHGRPGGPRFREPGSRSRRNAAGISRRCCRPARRLSVPQDEMKVHLQDRGERQPEDHPGRAQNLDQGLNDGTGLLRSPGIPADSLDRRPSPRYNSPSGPGAHGHCGVCLFQTD